MTIVAAWMSAETGVGPAIASPSQDCSGNWADLPQAATDVFLIGRTLKGNIDIEKKEIFGQTSARIDPANQAVSFYDSQVKSARLAVDTWALVSTRLHIIKDTRIYIGKMIWEGRFEANYKIESDLAPLASLDRKRFRK